MTTRSDASPARARWVWVLVVAAGVMAAIVVILALSGDGEGVIGAPTSRPGLPSTAPPLSTSASTSTTGTSSIVSTSTTATSTVVSTSTTTTTAPAGGYGAEELDYFSEVAGRSEYGDDTGVVHKWVEDVTIEVHGDPGSGDLAALDGVVADLQALMDAVGVAVVPSGGDVDLHFAPQADFASIEPNYVEGNLGYFYMWWNARGEITAARVLVSTTGTTAAERAHLIREELTQVLGLANDSWEYPESIFYQGWTDTQGYAEIDETLIEMLYRPEVEAGMEVEDALAALEAVGAG